MQIALLSTTIVGLIAERTCWDMVNPNPDLFHFWDFEARQFSHRLSGFRGKWCSVQTIGEMPKSYGWSTFYTRDVHWSDVDRILKMNGQEIYQFPFDLRNNSLDINLFCLYTPPFTNLPFLYKISLVILLTRYWGIDKQLFYKCISELSLVEWKSIS